jgi:hypothetical protein
MTNLLNNVSITHDTLNHCSTVSLCNTIDEGIYVVSYINRAY